MSLVTQGPSVQPRAKDLFATVGKIANAILYEGYMLYPYRSSAIKNQQRWNFGTLHPVGFAEIQKPVEQSSMITECLVKSDSTSTLDVRVRFLQLARRFCRATPGQSTEREEGFEKSIDFSGLLLSELIAGEKIFAFQFDETDAADPTDSAACFRQNPLAGTLSVQAEKLQPQLYKLRLKLENKTSIEGGAHILRNEALLHSFVSAHLLLGIHGGDFVSLLEPQEVFRQAASQCTNVGAFPVLVSGDGQPAGSGDAPGAGRIMLSSPIILYDYPTVAPESAGDFFDATEMDEMLALRVMTLTDEEKHEMRCGDSRARAILERTESLPEEHLMKVHGAIRGLRKVQQ